MSNELKRDYKKHRYRVTFNKRPHADTKTYNFGRTRNIGLRVDYQCAEVSFEMTGLKSAEDLVTFNSKLFRDAYRKILFVHAVKMSEGLKVRKLIIDIDGVKSVFDEKNDANGHFPFMFSMIGDRDLQLDSSWEGLEDIIINTTKSNQDEDVRFAAVHAYLSAKNRVYAIDKFTNLWTAMNAYYNYCAGQYEKQLKADYGVTELKRSLKLAGSDRDALGLICWLLDSHFPMIGEEGKSAELKALWKNNYEVEEYLRTLPAEDIEKLYDAASAELRGEEIPDRFAALSNRAGQFGVKLMPFLLLQYAYNWRCRLLHGNRSTFLFMAYNDYELSVMHTINYFLERFLNDAIPKIFEDSYWDQEKQQMAIDYMRHIRMKGGKDVFQKNLDALIAAQSVK